MAGSVPTSRSDVLILNEKLLEERSFWHAKLADPVTPAHPPRSYRGSSAHAKTWAELELPITGDVYQQLMRVTSQGLFLVYTTLMASLKICLQRYTGNPRIAVGSPARTQPDGAVQPRNTLVILDEITPELPFRQLLMNIRASLLEAYSRQNYPFERLLRDLGYAADGDTAPFFDVALRLTDIHSELSDVGHNITLSFSKETERIAGTLTYNAELFSEQMMTAFAGHFLRVLSQALSDTALSIGAIEMLTEQERQTILARWSTHDGPQPSAETVPLLFERQAAHTPDAIAVVFGDTALTYRELDARANQLAHHLRQQGLGPESRVGLCVERSLDLVVGVLGILKAGAAFVPLDPAYPAERLQFMLADAQVELLISQAALLRREPIGQSTWLPDHGVPVVCLDHNWDTIETQPTHAVSGPIHADQLAYIIYTSGSTGRPKGVLVAHRGLANLATAQITAFGVDQNSRVLQFAPISFDAAVSELLMALLSSATLVIASREAIIPGADLLDTLRSRRITTVTLPPSSLTILPQEQLPDLKTLVVAGEPCPAQLVAAWAGSRSFINAYGPTETTVCATLGSTEDARRDPPIGKPIPNVEVYLLDRQLRPVAVGVPGFLHIGGVGVARGYLNQPALTAERFIPHPFARREAEATGARLYATGDLARWLPDGALEYLGRHDQQVKLRGYRIELGEIEAVLYSHDDIQAAVVMVRQDMPGNAHVVAYVVPQEGHTLHVSDLHTYVRAHLPDYMVPAAFVTLSDLPRTTQGKIDYRALPAPDQTRPELATRLVAPRTPSEVIAARICAGLLGFEQIGVYDNFFELGGHSLLATQALSHIREECQVELPLRTFFKNPTVAGLGAAIDAALQSRTRQRRPAIVPVGRDRELPLSFAQQRLWFMDQLHPGNPAYNVPGALRLHGRLDVAALERSLQEIIRRHEALRTTFVLGSSGPIQRVAPKLTIALPTVDLQSLDAATQAAEVERQLHQEAATPFELAQGPLLRASLLQLAADEHILLFVIHHIVSDGWSIGVLINELTTLYSAFAASASHSEDTQLPELAVQYADFAVWQRDWLQGEVLESELAYWRYQLANVPPLLNLPTDRPRQEVQTLRGGSLTRQVPQLAARALNALSQQFDATLFMTLLSAFLTLLHRHTEQDDLVVGTDVANRNQAETEELIGFFVNVLPLRVNLGGNPTFRELVANVREVALGVYAHQDLPFEKLIDELGLSRSLSYTPLCQVLFVLQNAPQPPLELPGLTISPQPVDTHTVKFDLLVVVQESEHGLTLTWDYSTDLFDTTTIERMADQFERLLSAIVQQPDERLNTLETLSGVERNQHVMDQIERKESKRKAFMSVKPKAVSVPQETLIKTSLLQPDQPLPLVVEPQVDDVDLVEWAKNNLEWIEQELLQHGAILFRGFGTKTVEHFEQVAQAVTSELFGEYGDLPREGVSGNVYTSTPYPADKAILFHNESSHLHRWPMKQWFFCVKAAQQGGETPLADCRRVYQELRPELRERFAQKQLMYMRNFTDGLDVRWQDFFGTEDRAAVEAACGSVQVECEWLDKNDLRTKQVRQAVARHPKTGELLFFNQIPVHHIACLDQAARESLFALYSEEQLPRNVYYGDGTPIEDEVIQEILATYEKVAVRFPWQEGDIILLDNMLTAHARDPFVGPRKIVVAMGAMITAEERTATQAG